MKMILNSYLKILYYKKMTIIKKKYISVRNNINNMFLKRTIIEFINFMYENKGITKSENPFFGYYISIWYLRDLGLIRENGVNEKNQKIWVLTQKGNDVAKKLKEIEEMVFHGK